MQNKPNGLETLVDMNGTMVYFSDRYWTNFDIKLVEANEHIPHGIKYSLTLHDSNKLYRKGH